jgi:uncharacterized membrane protein SpoIIM required for sporulation
MIVVILAGILGLWLPYALAAFGLVCFRNSKNRQGRGWPLVHNQRRGS